VNRARMSGTRHWLGRAGIVSVAVLLLVLLGLSTSLSQGPVISTGSRDDDDGPQGQIRAASEWPLEVGVYYVADYPGTADDLPNAAGNGWGLYNTLRSAGWCAFSGNQCFIWGNSNAWEEDFKRPELGGNNDNWVDKVDLVFYEGHGNPSLFTFKTPWGNGTHDDSYLTYNDAYLAWGNVDLEWMALLSCSVLADSHELDWAWTMNRLHLLMGFETTAYDVSGFGTRFAQYINAGWRVSLAWMTTCDQKQPTGVRAKVLAEEYNHFYDTRYYQYPDAWDYTYYRWEHVCGSEPARYVDASAVDTMPVFETPPLSLAESTAAWGNLGKAFEVPTTTGASVLAEGYYTSTVDGRELQMDAANGLYYYVDHNQLFSPTLTSGVHVLSPESAHQIADTFLADNGLMPGDAQYYEVVNETVQTVETQPAAGLSPAQAEVQQENLVGYQVIYSRILTYTTTAQADPQAFSVVGPGSKLKVYVAPEGGAATVAADGGPGAVVGAMGGWRRISQPTGMSVLDTVPVLPITKTEQLFLQLEPQVALGQVPFDDPTSKEVLTYTLGYWEESTGVGQDQLYPAWVLDARYEGTVGGGDPLVVTGTCYIPANETYMRPLAKIESHSDLGDNILPGTVITFTAADASKPLNELGYNALLDFALGSGGPYTYDWYLGSVDSGNKIGSGRNLSYEVVMPVGGGHAGPVSQTIILVVTDIGTTHASQNYNTDRAAFDVMPGVFLPVAVRAAP
jgi:hypothetical protein